MKLSYKFHLVALSILTVMTLLVVMAGTLIISDLTHTLQDQILYSELMKIREKVSDTLNHSGVRAAARAAAEIDAQLKEKPPNIRTSRMVIIEVPDHVIFHPDYATGDEIQRHELNTMFLQKEGRINYTEQRAEYYGVYTTMEPVGWLICLSIKKKDMYAKRMAYLKNIGMISGLLFLVTAGVIHLFVRSFDRRIQVTLDCVKEIENGNHAVRIPRISTRDEIGRLQEGVNAMSRKIQARTAQQQQAETALRTHRNHLEQLVSQRTAELEKATKAAEKARKKAEVASLAKSEFIANMSHELRTPLNAILGYSQLMQRDSHLHAEQQEYLNIINRSGEHLLTLINDVLEISKIEAKRTTLNPEAFDLHVMLRDIYGMFKLRANEKQLTFDFDESDDLPRYVIADANKFRQIMINLLGNAVKFTDKGGIAVRAQVKSKTSEELCLAVEVEDTGQGISQEELKKVFLAFEQTESGQKKQESTGLGMAISQRYARLMGGDITLTSRLGEGSSFYFHCIVHPASAKDVTTKVRQKHMVELASGQEIPRILVVEDKLESRVLLVKYLEQAGFDVQEAKNGKEAVERFAQWAPHFIWMDVRMPVMAGLEATRRIRRLPGGDQVRIAAITASALEEERDMILSAGCDELVRKPYRISTIFRIMEAHLGLEYLHKEEEIPESAQGQFDPCSVKLDTLPAALYNALTQAVLELDTERTLALVK
ncbi:MAG: ATP-binding protein, partial [Desulfobacterales bacterium]|nr:ATP-binding protein [Desulfobacterales bacterium]